MKMRMLIGPMAAMMLSACGQAGPLVLPEPPPAPAAAPASPPAPSAPAEPTERKKETP